MKVLEKIIESLPEDAPVKDVRIGPFWTAVLSRHCGLASTTFEHEHTSRPPVREAGQLVSMGALDLCGYTLNGSLLERSIGLAAINSLLEVELDSYQEINAADVLIKQGKGLKVCIVGHFPFIPKLQETAGELWVLERRPQTGDLPASEAKRVIPGADVVGITGTALINGTMDGLLSLCRRDALVVVLGPTTPLTSVWFDYGVDVISGTRVVEPQIVIRLVSEGIIFSQFHGRGVKLLTRARAGLELPKLA